MFRPLFRFLLSAVTFFSSVALAPAAGLTYSSPDGHYSFAVPAGWQQLSKDRMSTMNRQAAQLSGRRDIKFSAGFYAIRGTKIGDLPFPYLLIQEHALNTPSYTEILKGFDQENVSKGTKELKKIPGITDANFSNLRVDRDRNMLFMNLEMQLTNGVKGKALCAFCLGRKGITQLNFYSLASHYPTDLPTFEAVVDTFKYEPGYEYDEDEAKKNDFAFNLKGIFSSGTNALGFDWAHVFWAAIGGAVVGLLGLIVVRVAFRPRRREVELDPWAHWRH